MTELVTPRSDTRLERIPWKPGASCAEWLDTDRYLAGLPPDKVIFVGGNLLLDEGVADLLDGAFGLGGQPFDATHARIGIGDSTTAEATGQTGLLGANQLYKGMEPGCPFRTGRTITARSAFGPSEANFDWNEWTFDNGAGGGPGRNLSRKVAVWGAKPSGSTRVVTLGYTV